MINRAEKDFRAANFNMTEDEFKNESEDRLIECFELFEKGNRIADVQKKMIEKNSIFTKKEDMMFAIANVLIRKLIHIVDNSYTIYRGKCSWIYTVLNSKAIDEMLKKESSNSEVYRACWYLGVERIVHECFKCTDTFFLVEMALFIHDIKKILKRYKIGLDECIDLYFTKLEKLKKEDIKKYELYYFTHSHYIFATYREELEEKSKYGKEVFHNGYKAIEITREMLNLAWKDSLQLYYNFEETLNGQWKRLAKATKKYRFTYNDFDYSMEVFSLEDASDGILTKGLSTDWNDKYRYNLVLDPIYFNMMVGDDYKSEEDYYNHLKNIALEHKNEVEKYNLRLKQYDWSDDADAITREKFKDIVL